ncbi:MAG: site-2 protease family protein [Planctomycetota bacterium]
MVKSDDAGVPSIDGGHMTGIADGSPEPSAPKVRLAADVVFQTVDVGGVRVHRAEHQGTGQHFQFGAAEHHVASLLDGRRTATEIVQQAHRDGLEWSESDVAEFIGLLVGQKLAVTVDADAPQSVESRIVPPSSLAPDPSHALPRRASESTKPEQLVKSVNQDRALDESTSAETLDARAPLTSSVGQRTPTETEVALRGEDRENTSGEATKGDVESDASIPDSSVPSPKPPASDSIRTKESPTQDVGTHRPWAVIVLKTLSSLISFRFPLAYAGVSADRVLALVRPMLSPYGLVVGLTIIGISLIMAWSNSAELTAELKRLFSSRLWMMLLVVWAVMKVVHEMGHAVAARYHDVRVGKTGIMFFMLAPLAYVDVTAAWVLHRRWPRIQIALSGVYFELLVASLAIWLWKWLPVGLAQHLAAQIFFVAGPATLLVNANPLLRLDGYYVLSDLLDIPNLRGQGRQLLSRWLHRRWFLIEKSDAPLTGWRRPAAATHAVASILFQVVWMGGLILGVSLWAGPLGMAMSLAAIGSWVCLPTARWLHGLWNHQEDTDTFSVASHRRRVIWMAFTLLATGQFVLTLPSPVCERVPVVVRFADDQFLRAPASGFVRAVNFASGDRVRAGEDVLRIEEPELLMKVMQIERQLEATEIQWQQQQQAGSLGLAEATRRKFDSLLQQSRELSEQYDALRVSPEFDGVVLSSDISSLQDRFVQKGELLVHVGLPTHKELLISLGESELESYSAALQRESSVPVFLRNGHDIRVELTPTRPSGSRSIPHPAMAATASGPLAVEPLTEDDGSTSQRLLTPRFEAVVPLSPAMADEVHSGQVGYVVLQDPRSIGSRLIHWFQNR